MCDKTFGVEDYLKRHIKNFHKKKPRKFHCLICQSPFPQKGNLTTHIEAVHGNIKKHRCPDCPEKSYSQQNSLNKHKKRYHK